MKSFEIGRPMVKMLQQVEAKGEMRKFIDKICHQNNYKKPGFTAIESQSKPTEMIQPSEDILESISMREREILKLIADGLRNKKIADKIFISPGIVKKHVYNIFKKLKTSSRITAIKKAKEWNLV